MALTLRLVKGSELTYQELDDNFTYLSSSIASGGGPVNISGYVTTSSFNAYTGSNTSQFAGTASFATTASFASNATSASYVKLIQGPNIQINYTTLGIEITGSTGGGSGDGLDLLALPASNQIRLTSASLPIGNAITVPFATSASFLTTDITRIATGSVTASVTPSQFSIVSGSTTEFVVTGTGMTLGSALTDIHNITGSVRITGSLDTRNNLTVTGSTFLRSTGSNSAGTGSNLVPDSTGWAGLNWTGDNATGFYRTTPDANIISCSAVPPLVVGETYIATLISTGLTLSQTPVNLAVGDAGTIMNVFSQGTTFYTSFRATTTNATMSIIPGVSVFGPWDGTASVALYRVTSSNSTATILPTAGTTGVEFRPSPGNSSTNLAIGNQAGQKLVPGQIGGSVGAFGSTYIGQEAGASDGSGYGQAFLGYRAGLVNTGYNNTFLGAYAGDRNTLGNSNTFIGTAAGGSNDPSLLSSGSHNTGIGVNVLRVNNTFGNVAIGNSALIALRTGIGGNIAVGYGAGVVMSSGSYNTIVGYGAGAKIIGSTRNTCLGFSAGGPGAGGSNVYIGNAPGFFHNGTNAIFIGSGAGYLNQSSNGGIYIGNSAGYRDVSGSNNILIGNYAGEQMQITAVSSSTVTQSTVAQTNNVIIGEQAAQYMWAGSSNTVLGTNAARKYNTTTGGASGTIPTGSNLNNSIYIGFGAGSPALGAATNSQLTGSNEIVIGANQVGFGSNTTTIGTNSTSASYLYGDLIVTGTLGDVMVLPFERPLPSGKPTGSIALSGSGGTFEGMYVYNGTSWTKVGP